MKQMHTITHILLTWYANHQRTLPWRGEKDVYKVWLSEIILQQTRIDQGTDYYLRFIRRWPTVQALAQASEDEVMKMWEGLGYYSRARNLYRTAQQVAKVGDFPHTLQGLQQLPGVGPYTAAAIGSMAYGLPAVAMDGNAYRLLGRLFAIEKPMDSADGQKDYRACADALLPSDSAGTFNQAMMDFASLVCTPHSPKCTDCPLAIQCAAHEMRREEHFPIKKQKIRKRERHLCYFFVHTTNSILLRRRGAGDIWRGLYEPYLTEMEGSAEECFRRSDWVQQWLSMPNVHLQELQLQVKHQLTHQDLTLDFYALYLPSSKGVPIPVEYHWYRLEETAQLALPQTLRKTLNAFLEELKVEHTK